MSECSIARIVDLSIALDAGTPVYPGDPHARFCIAHTIAQHGFNVSRMEMASHCGTHCDAPYHFLEDAARIDELPLDRFVGRAAILDVRPLRARTAIGRSMVVAHEPRIAGASIVILNTGWSERLGDESYFEHPYLAEDACSWLLGLGVRTIGVDAMNIDQTTSAAIDRADFPCHREISAAGGVIVENLTNLDAVDFEDPWVSVLPLRYVGGDGAPARAVALKLEQRS